MLSPHMLSQVSPAKFAWLVHSVGVALASLSPISSWVGLQIGYTKAVLDALGVSPPLDGFLVVLRSLPFRFFPLFYLLLIVMVLVSGRDFGPMAKAESSSTSSTSSAPKAQSPSSDSRLEASTAEDGGGGGITPKAGTPLRSRNALVPFATVIVVTFAGMILDGISKIEIAGNEVTFQLWFGVWKRAVFSRSGCVSCAEARKRSVPIQPRQILWADFWEQAVLQTRTWRIPWRRLAACNCSRRLAISSFLTGGIGDDMITWLL